MFAAPLTTDQAFDRVDRWLAQPPASAAGNLVDDTHLAALAVEHRGTVVSYDSDFGRFAGVRWREPWRLS